MLAAPLVPEDDETLAMEEKDPGFFSFMLPPKQKHRVVLRSGSPA